MTVPNPLPGFNTVRGNTGPTSVICPPTGVFGTSSKFALKYLSVPGAKVSEEVFPIAAPGAVLNEMSRMEPAPASVLAVALFVNTFSVPAGEIVHIGVRKNAIVPVVEQPVGVMTAGL